MLCSLAPDCMSSKEVNAMPIKEWRAFSTSIVRGVRKQLCPSAPRRIRDRLDEFEARAKSVAGMRARTRWADDFDAFTEGPPCVRAAAGRVLAPQFKKVIRLANRVQQNLKRLRKAIETRTKRDTEREPQQGISRAESKRRLAQVATEVEKSSKILIAGQKIMKTVKKR